MAHTSEWWTNFLFSLYVAGEVVFVFLTSLPFLLIILVRKTFSGSGKKITGKTVLVTGSARGLGRALSFEFAKQGCKLICVDVNTSVNEKTVEEINAQLGKPETATSMFCDVGDFESVRKLAEEVNKKHGKVDILVNNAGIVYGMHNIEDIEEGMAKKVVNVNLLSSLWLVQAFLPQMKANKDGHIVFINSISSLIPLGDATIYTATKYGLLGFTEGLMDELSRSSDYSNIKITSVHPFFVRTEGLKNLKINPKYFAMDPHTAARYLIKGVRREYKKFAVPGNELIFWIVALSRVLPHTMYQKLVNRIHDKVLI
ncbi:hypothetical protein RUM43_000225 [Polyplax serrata]|uniref:Short-chain dehydrogenase/reductase 3 n=1 Tax=Polyplax serrata TaxID=468196 RepID=A0AAN8XNP2_POLSC